MQTVLVASEAPWIRNLVRSAFLAPGDVVVEVSQGKDVRDAVAQHAPDVAVVDMTIGTMGGIAVTIDLHLEAGAHRLPRVPVVLLLDRVADRFLARRAGADLALIKPVDPSELRKAVRTLLASEAPRPAPDWHEPVESPEPVAPEAEPAGEAEAEA